MQVAAVIPTFNRRHTLGRAIDSVLAQTAAVEEIIVVDDGSTDGTASYLRSNYPDVQLVEQDNRGVSAARNAGIRATSCEWIALLDSDDSWLPKKIASIEQAQTEQPGYSLYHSDEIWIRNGARVNAMLKHQKSGGWIFPNCLPLCVISPSAAVIKRQTLIDEGLFDESLPACEDYDMWLKICHHQPVGFVEQPLITKYGGHDDQLSRAFIAMDRFRILALDRLLDKRELSADDQALTLQTLHNKLKVLLQGAHKHGNLELIEVFSPLQQKWQDTVAC